MSSEKKVVVGWSNHLGFAPWTQERYITLDDLVSKAWRKILKADSHCPTELLYLNKADKLGPNQALGPHTGTQVVINSTLQQRWVGRLHPYLEHLISLPQPFLHNLSYLNLSYTTFPPWVLEDA